jgi:uncharacterized membrane protein
LLPVKLSRPHEFIFFLDFNIQYWIYWKWSFIIFFYLLCIKLSQSHDLDHEFNKLAQVELGCFFNQFFLFHLSTLGWFEIGL